MIVYPSPFHGSTISLELVLELTKDFYPSCTEGGVKILDSDVTLRLIDILRDNNIPYEDANISISERFRQSVREQGIDATIAKFGVRIN